MRIDTPLRPNPEKRRSPPCQSMPASTGHSFEAPQTIAPYQTVARMPLVPQNSVSSPEAVLILVRITVPEALHTTRSRAVRPSKLGFLSDPIPERCGRLDNDGYSPNTASCALLAPN